MRLHDYSQQGPDQAGPLEPELDPSASGTVRGVAVTVPPSGFRRGRAGQTRCVDPHRDAVADDTAELTEQAQHLPVGTPLPSDPNGAPRSVCPCHRVRTHRVRGRGVVRLVWSGALVPAVGLGLVVLAVLVVVRAEHPGVRVVAGAALITLLAACVAGARSGGHRGWCSAGTAAYWVAAFPAVLLGALSSF